MVKLLFFLLLLLNGILLSHTVIAQKIYVPGYVVLNTGDTLRGQVMDRRETLTGTDLLTKIRFKAEDRNRRRKYRARELVSYQANGITCERHRVRSKGISLQEADYEIVPDDGEWVFLRVVSRGKLSHYQWEWVEDDDSSVDTADFFRKENSSLLVRATQGILGLKRKNLVEYFQDCPNLQEKIESKVFKHPAEVADYYNQDCQ